MTPLYLEHPRPIIVCVIGYNHSGGKASQLAVQTLDLTLKRTQIKDVAVELPPNLQGVVSEYVDSKCRKSDRLQFEKSATAVVNSSLGLAPLDQAELAAQDLQGSGTRAFLAIFDTASKHKARVHCVDASLNDPAMKLALRKMASRPVTSPDEIAIFERNRVIARRISEFPATSAVLLTGSWHAGHGDQSVEDYLRLKGIRTITANLEPRVKPCLGAWRRDFGDIVTTSPVEAADVLSSAYISAIGLKSRATPSPEKRADSSPIRGP